MTKDRRLGRGLAALLGSPLDESNVVEGSVAESNEGALSNSQRDTLPISGEAEQTSSPATTVSAPRPQAVPKPRPAVASHNPSRVTGSVPLNSVLPATTSASSASITTGQSLKHSTSPGASTPATAAQSTPLSSSSAQTTIGAPEIDVNLIDANPFQPRRQFNPEEIASLAESIKEHQQLQPVLVRKVGSRYQLISGERRLRATIHAGLTKVRAEIREADDRLVAELAIVENLQRKDLNPIEKALSFRRYLDEHVCTQDELAKRLKIDRSTIANLMRLLELPRSILEAVQSDTLSAGHARALLPLGEESQQCAMAARIRAEGWSVRQTEHAVSDILAGEDGNGEAKPNRGKRNAARTVTPQIGSLEQELRRSLGTKIDIRQSARGRGKIVVHFHSAEEFERIRDILVPASQRAAA